MPDSSATHEPQAPDPHLPAPAGAAAAGPAPSSPVGADRPAGAVKGSWWVFLVLATAAGIVAAIIAAGFLSESLALLGIPDPGPWTTAGLPFVRGAAVMTTCVAIGSFLLSSFLVSPRVRPESAAESQDFARRAAAAVERLRARTAPGDALEDDEEADEDAQSLAWKYRPGMDPLVIDLKQARLGVDGYLASRTGAWAALVTAVLAVLLVPMYLSDVSGETLATAMQASNWSVALGQVSTSLAFVWVAIIAAVTGVGALLSSRWIMQPVWLLLSLFMFVPLGLEGHSATGGDHDYGTNSYLWHLLFVGLWIGGLLALLAHGRRKGAQMTLAVRRYSMLAFVSAAGMAISGLINAAIRLRFSEWLTTGYGRLILAKAIAVVVLALVGLAHRTRTIPQLERAPQLFRRLAAVELLLMAATVGVAVALGRTPPPPPRVADINTMDIQLGYKLFVAPTWTNVWTMWRFDIVFGTLAILLTWAYLWGVFRVRRDGGSWPWWRTAWFLGGNIMLLVTMCSGIGLYMPALFSMHMVGHMILSMGVPVFWVLGGPITLWRQALRPGAPGEPGPRAWLGVLVDNPVTRFLTHPAVNTIQFLVAFYGLYLDSIYSVAVSEHAGHLGMNVMFLLSGTIYFWELIGVDPAPRRTDPKIKLLWLSFSLPIHMFFGVTLMMLQTVLAYDFYSTLGLPWQPDLLQDQLVGGGVAWASGQFPLLIVYIAIVRQWWTDDNRQMKAYDRHADATDDEEMAAYNEMLAAMNAGRNPETEFFAGEATTQPPHTP
ncbi:copper resistance protein [Corynebacterium sp. 13CS0277]|uniref:cytochrome c oxidase assembly protein n=1 Tax=Corynebacterium sp. 13CS0277 TaxID=2071994 RepID=UPI000D039913|nr:cytochrome c oxidase assembly protein [Corynebacterium sp. 13CS0277]PRQ10363.1 copper resistance protein [Corynebacterium sp. 13CS0277]